jgi:DNA polymerase-3 subunit beta
MIETEESVSSSVGSGLKITCSKDDLVQALGVVSRAVSTRTSVQILGGILLEPHESGLRVAATDMELSLRATLPAQLQGDGSIVLPGKTFADIARLLPSDEVSIEHKPSESVVHIVSGTASYTLNTYNPEDFPRLPELDAVTTFAVEREPLL